MDDIEKKEIRGVNLKTIYWLVTSSCGIIFTVLFTYFSILQRLSAMEITNIQNGKYNELQFKTMDLKVSALEIQVKELSNKYDAIRDKTK